MHIKKAVIVAAGLSSRLYPLTLDKPKGLLEINDTALLKRSISQLNSIGITDISIVVGYKDSLIRNLLGPNLTYIYNPFFKHCNNLGSLWFAKSFINQEPFIYLHGDIIYDAAILEAGLTNFYKKQHDIHLLVDYGRTDEEAMKVTCNQNQFLIESNKDIQIEKAAGEWIGIALVKNTPLFFNYIDQVLVNDNLNAYDTYAMTIMAKDSYNIYCDKTPNSNWKEIDFLKDYEDAKQLFK